MIDKLATLSIFELLAFIMTAGVMLSMTLILPYKIIKEIKKWRKESK